MKLVKYGSTVCLVSRWSSSLKLICHSAGSLLKQLLLFLGLGALFLLLVLLFMWDLAKDSSSGAPHTEKLTTCCTVGFFIPGVPTLIVTSVVCTNILLNGDMMDSMREDVWVWIAKLIVLLVLMIMLSMLVTCEHSAIAIFLCKRSSMRFLPLF